jgi:hypothetical protein
MHLSVIRGRGTVAKRVDNLIKAASLLREEPARHRVIVLLRLLALLMERRHDEASNFGRFPSIVQEPIPPGPYLEDQLSKVRDKALLLISYLQPLCESRKDRIQFDLARSDVLVRQGSFREAHQLAEQAAALADKSPPLYHEGRCARERMDNLDILLQLAGPSGILYQCRCPAQTCSRTDGESWD